MYGNENFRRFLRTNQQLSFPSTSITPHFFPAYSKRATEVENSPLLMQFRLLEDEILLFNNRRILHGRCEIRGEFLVKCVLIEQP